LRFRRNEMLGNLWKRRDLPSTMAVRVILATDRNWDEHTGVFSCEVKHIRRIDLGENATNWTVVQIKNKSDSPTMNGEWPHIARAAVSVQDLYYFCNNSVCVSFDSVPISEINMSDDGVDHTVLVVV
jgi:hypothetical protein